MKLFCVADEQTVRGFRLAGIPGQVVSTPAEAAEVLQASAAQPDCGIVVLTEAVADGIRQKVEAFRLEHAVPLLVEIPGPQGSLAGRKGLHQLAQQAVGMRIS